MADAWEVTVRASVGDFMRLTEIRFAVRDHAETGLLCRRAEGSSTT
jgi:hypothetical protein